MVGRAWTEDELNYLQEHWKTEKTEDIAKRLDRSFSSVRNRGFRLGLCETQKEERRNWSEEDIDVLDERWGIRSIRSTAELLGRSISSVKQKANHLGLIDARFSYEGITINQLALAINVSYSTVKNWVKLHDFPTHSKIFTESARVKVVQYHEFWKWAEKNKQMVDFSRIEKNILGPEPDWVESKRNADFIKRTKIKKSHNHAWTTEEDNILKGMLSAYKHTYPEISQRLNRSEGAIKRRIGDLGLKARPVRLNNHIKYTQEEIDLIVTLFDKGHCLEDIASRINKSALGVRGKLERMGYSFVNGVPIKTKEKKSDKEILMEVMNYGAK